MGARRDGRGLWSFVPRFDDPIAPELYRMSGKIRVGALLMLMVLNAATLADPEQLGYDPDFILRLPDGPHDPPRLQRAGSSAHAMPRRSPNA